jgi:hypothetical protein
VQPMDAATANASIRVKAMCFMRVRGSFPILLPLLRLLFDVY